MKIGRQNNTQDCRAPSRADFFVELHVPFGRYRVGMGFLPKKAGIIESCIAMGLVQRAA